MTEEGKPEIITGQKFEFSAENSPPLEILESKVFAVHATPILPKDGVLKAGARDISYDKTWEGGEPPTFRPTIHFALGGLVSQHDDFSWEEHDYAVVAPLKALEHQLVNVSPHDTFILGDYHLTEDATLLVPRGTHVSKLPPAVKVLEYDKKTGLRKAVDQLINEKGGWSIGMEEETAIGSVTYIEDAEVNSAEFFTSLFEKYPYVSYGTHAHSERGDAFRFGIIDQTINWAVHAYYGWPTSSAKIQFYRSLVKHNSEKLKTFLRTWEFPPEAQQSFKEKVGKLSGWINILDIDLEIRQRFGRSLEKSPKLIKKLYSIRNDSQKLREFVLKNINTLFPGYEGNDLTPEVLAEVLSSIPPPELQEFMQKYPEAFQRTDIARFYANYAIDRWMLIKTKKAYGEGLDATFRESIAKFSSEPTKERESDLFRTLEEFLTTKNNRLSTALDILKQPAFIKYLTEKFGFNFPEGGAKTLDDIIRSHPDTRLIFEQQQSSLTPDQQIAYDFLTSMGRIHALRYDKTEELRSFQEAKSLSSALKSSRDRLEDELETIMQPMRSARNLDDVLAGRKINLYEQLRRDTKQAIDIWQKVGLDPQFRKRFANDDLFWQSPISLLDIYKMLNANKQQEENST